MAHNGAIESITTYEVEDNRKNTNKRYCTIKWARNKISCYVLKLTKAPLCKT